MEYVIYTFGGQAELIHNIFNGIARAFASDGDYFTIVGKFALSVGGVWAGTRAIFHANIGIFSKQWFFPVFLAFTFLFSPKVTVWIKDDLANTAYKIDNIPFAIAFFSSVPSTMSYAMAEKIERELNIADSVRNSKAGLMFGAKLVGKFRDLKIQDPVLLDNVKQFCKQCYLKPWVMGNILGKRKEAEEANNMLAFINANIPYNFGIYYRDPETRELSFKDCHEAVRLITTQMQQEARSPKLMAALGSALGLKNDNVEQLAVRIAAMSRDTLGVLQHRTQEAHVWVTQSMMLNAYRESLDDWREGHGHYRLWPELISMNASRGLYQQSFGWLIAGEMASQALPLMQTVLFLLVVSSIFLVFPFAMLPGGLEVLRLWIKLMIWVNTWPVFFAIINAIGMHVLSLRSGLWSPDFGLDKFSQGQFSDLMLHTYAMVQLFASAVPMLSWVIISKSGAAFVNLTEKLLTTAVGGSLGMAAVDNVLNIDNVHMGNRQLAQQHIGPSLNMGSVFDNGILRATQTQDGNTYLDERASQLATNYRGSALEMQALQDSYNDSVSHMSSLNQRKSSLDSLEKAQMQDYASRWLASHDVADAANERIARDMRIVSGEGYNSQEGFNDRTSKSTETHSGLNIEGHVRKEGSVGIKIPGTEIGTKIDVGGSITVATGVGARNAHDISRDSSMQQTQNYQESLDRVKGYAKTHDIKDGYGTSETLTSGLQTTWREQEQIAIEQAATAQKMQQYQQQQSHIEQNQLSIDQNWNDEVLEAVQARHTLANKQEALTYLNEHGGEGKQVLAELIATKYHTNIPQEIQQKSLDLQHKIGHTLDNDTIDFGREKLRLQSQYKQEKMPETIKQQVADHLDHQQKKVLEQKAQAYDEKSFPDHMRIKFEDKQKQYENTSGSTLLRTVKEASDNTGATSAWNATGKALQSAQNIFKSKEEEKNE